MQVLVIGGTGAIGRYVVRQLADAGHEVTVYHRGETEADLPDGVRHVHDVRAAIPVLHFPPEMLAKPRKLHSTTNTALRMTRAASGGNSAIASPWIMPRACEER